jgi:REP element-mobilizing transposase RayT
MARVVPPGVPTVSRNEVVVDSRRSSVTAWCSHHGAAVWAYCLMPDHVRLIVVPSSVDGLRCAIGEANRRYSRRIIFREGWRGRLWQGRFASCPMDEHYLLAATRHAELKPVRPGLAKSPGAYPWSSAAPLSTGRDDALVNGPPSDATAVLSCSDCPSSWLLASLFPLFALLFFFKLLQPL